MGPFFNPKTQFFDLPAVISGTTAANKSYFGVRLKIVRKLPKNVFVFLVAKFVASG